jgi:hypothetical protein
MKRGRQRVSSFINFSLTQALTRLSQCQQFNASYANISVSYLSDHKWTEEEWDTTQIGFVTGMDPNFSTAQAHIKFKTEICKRAEWFTLQSGRNSKQDRKSLQKRTL